MLRATTNLKVPPHLQLPRKEMKSDFLYVYNKGYVGLEPVFMQRLWLTTFFPEIANDPNFGKARKGVRAYAQAMEKHPQPRAGFLRLRKVNDQADPHFVVAVPLAEFSAFDLSDYIRRLHIWFLGDAQDPRASDHTAQALVDELKSGAEAEVPSIKSIPASQILPKLHLDGKGHAALTNCFIGLRMQMRGTMAVVFADFKISKPVAQQLTTTEWMMIRNIDLYPLLLQWQTSLWGYRGDAPLTSFPMSKVAKTLPPVREGQARVNKYGLSISPTGEPIWLPEKLDNTQRYEDLYAQVGDKGDDTFGLIDIDRAAEAMTQGTELKVHLPANIPVLIDWVNNKYAYTQGNGVLKVQDLARFKAADAAHANNILKYVMPEDKMIYGFGNMAETAGYSSKIFFTEKEIQAIDQDDPILGQRFNVPGGLELEEYFDKALAFHKNMGGDKLRWADISTQGDFIWRPLARFIEGAQAAVLANMDAVNRQYSVHGVAVRLGWMTLVAKYGNRLAETEAEANTITAAATKAAKGIDPNWKMPSVPLIMDNPERPFSLLPHQLKVMNLMQDSPDFAILPVQAGGGKTPIAIVDILNEIKANRSQPYLVMCPGALVPQYVKEVTHFTSGKVNVIPIATDVLFRNGFERLTQMIESAPRNSIVVVNYDVLRHSAYDVCYGTTSVKVYPVIEFLRQFNFGYALMDESHNLKNDSQRTRAAQILIADIPKKRLASGTMAHDSPSDLAIQIAQLDPTLFGSRDDFNAAFAAPGRVKGGKVQEWRPGAQQDIMARIKSRIVVAKAMRKEWAALLPRSRELIHRVPLSEAQKTVYEAILTEALDKMREDAAKNPALKKFFEGAAPKIEKPQLDGDQGPDEEADEEAEQAADEDAGDDISALLGFYLARIEQFLTAPGKDELGARILSGNDLRSPKVNKILEIVKQHIDSGLPGKVLIFTNYIESAEEIFEAAGPELQKSGILYTATNKVEDGAAFEHNAAKKWMVGVENSMNTGLNFQFVSRLIRVENVWNPGTLEQGNARINRPEMKKADERPEIFYDWIVCDNTVDITKVARLISKIVAVSKFENADSMAYEALPDLPIIAMNAESIQMKNGWDTTLADYAQVFKEHNGIRAREYADYKAKHGDLVLTRLEEAPQPKDAALMAQVPYVPGLDLYKSAEQGLVRVDEYLRLSPSDYEDEEEGADEAEDANGVSKEQRKVLELVEGLKGQMAHTEFGDGIIKSVAFKSKRINIALASGYMIRVRFASAFVMTKKTVSGKSMREQILGSVPAKMPIVAAPTAIPIRFRVDNAGLRKAAKQKEAEEREAERQAEIRKVEAMLNVELHFSISNGFLGITYYPEEGSDASNALQALGFRPVEPYVFAEVTNAAQLKKQFDKWQAAGFTFDKAYRAMGAANGIHALYEMVKKGRAMTNLVNYKVSSKAQLQNWMRMELKPSTDPKAFKPYALIEDGGAYLVMHTRGQPANKAAMQVKSPGIRWQQSAPALVFYGLDLAHTATKMKEVLAAGIQVANLRDLQKEFKRLKKLQVRNTKDE